MPNVNTSAQRVAARYAAQSAEKEFDRKAKICFALLHELNNEIQETQRDFSKTEQTDWGYAGSLGHVQELLEEAIKFLRVDLGE
jgi:hypothetical protein